MSEVSDQAIKYFEGECNCSQSVLMSFAERFDLTKEKAQEIAMGFGAGMGRLQKTCGAVSGSYMVIGLIGSCLKVPESAKKDFVYSMVAEFNKKFISKHQYSDCRDLIEYDLNNVEDMERAYDSKVFEIKCQQYIRECVEILEEYSKRI